MTQTEPSAVPGEEESQSAEARGEASSEDQPAPAVVLSPEELKALLAQADEVAGLKDKIKRLEAEFVNETRRIRRTAENDRKFAIEKVLIELLPVLDALERAESEASLGGVDARIQEGMGLITRELAALLERHGVERLDPLGETFDPSVHEAMTLTESSEVPPGRVCLVMRRGYTLHARVIRPAQVVVSKAPAQAPAAREGDAPASDPKEE